MSIRVMSRVWDDFPGGGSELLALLALADWSDDDGRCYPSIASISRKARLSRSQAQRLVHSLIDQGFVTVTDNINGGAPGSTRKYKIVLDRLTGRVDATPTGRISATGSAHATGRTHAQDGSHPCGETGSAHATLTVIEPSVNRQENEPRQDSQFVLPDWIPTDLWDTWHTGRRKSATDAQKNLMVKKLTRWRDAGLDWHGSLENSAMNGYQGIFKPDAPKQTRPQRSSNSGKLYGAGAAIFETNPTELFDV